MGTSYQKGWVSLRGKNWYGYFRRTILDPETNQPKTVSSPVALGLKTEMSKSQARKSWQRRSSDCLGKSQKTVRFEMGPLRSAGLFATATSLKEADWREETAKVKEYMIQADLVDHFEDVRLENFDKFTLQNHLNQLAKRHSRDRVL